MTFNLGNSPGSLLLGTLPRYLSSSLGYDVMFVCVRPNIRIVSKFQDGRCFVVGGQFVSHIYREHLTDGVKTDAAHVHPPTGGQGLNCGIQDSVSIRFVSDQ